MLRFLCPAWSRLLVSGMLTLCTLFPAIAQAWDGVVVSIHDGDTVLVAPHGAPHGDMGVRLYGINAPELNQPGGRESCAALQNTVRPGDAVKVIPLADDRYNRVIGLIIRDGVILNYEQVRQGQAWVYPQYCKARFCKEWRHAEQAARERRYGLWGEASPVPPWVWRKKEGKLPQ